LLELAQKDPLKAAPSTWLLLVKRVMLFAGWYSVCGMWDVGLVMALGNGGSDFHFG
jgi:hypothetical protein